MSERNLRVVALGGGHGLAATLSSLRAITTEITAIVTVADNGGSSGRLREEFSIYPPGDLRMALAALCSDDEWGRSWAEIMQYRYVSSGPLDGHAVGNLLLAALWNKGEGAIAGLDRVGALLKVVGRVLPMAQEPLDIEASFINSSGRFNVTGQVEVATAKGRLESLRVIPENPTAEKESLLAISQADWVVMGPGSWFSSVLPHVLVPEQRVALSKCRAKKILVLNLDSANSNIGQDSQGEYSGYTPLEHIEILAKYAPDLNFDYVIADETLAWQSGEIKNHLSSTGGELVIGDIRDGTSPIHHDPKKLRSLFAHMAG